MHCPTCTNTNTRVVDSRLVAGGMEVRRRRECERCGYRFTTLEEGDILDIMVIKNDGSHESYSREKIERGLKKSLEKRPFTAEQFQLLLHKIERDIQKKRKREVTSRAIGEIVMKHLKHFDMVAYIRFASVYRSFQDAQMFQKELTRLLPSSLKKKKIRKRVG